MKRAKQETKKPQRQVQSQLRWAGRSGSSTGHSWIDPPSRTRCLGPGTYMLPLNRGVRDLVGCRAKIYRVEFFACTDRSTVALWLGFPLYWVR